MKRLKISVMNEIFQNSAVTTVALPINLIKKTSIVQSVVLLQSSSQSHPTAVILKARKFGNLEISFSAVVTQVL